MGNECKSCSARPRGHEVTALCGLKGLDCSPTRRAGLELALVSGAAGMLSLGMRCIEHVCNQSDTLLSVVPAGGIHAQVHLENTVIGPVVAQP